MSAAAARTDDTVAVIGATGSVGLAACEVAADLGFRIRALGARSSHAELARLCRRHRPELAALADDDAAQQLADALRAAGLDTKVVAGEQGLAEAAAAAGTVVAAASGVAGIGSTMAAVAAGRRILLANKESLVLAGGHMMAQARKSGAAIVPIDSEHGALLELLHYTADRRDHLERVWLTASGGPFHNSDIDLAKVTPQMAARHPVWSMGMKISIDSATLMNKGLEVIEASVLFDLAPDQVDVVVHNQGLVHAVVEFADGSSIAQCGPPDMRTAIARALVWPRPHRRSYGRIDWRQVGSLDFAPPDCGRFPCLRLAREALSLGGIKPAVLNAANEVAVAAFCANEGVAFTDIPPIIEQTLAQVDGSAATLEQLLSADQAARAAARDRVAALGG